MSSTLKAALGEFEVTHCTDGLSHLVGPVPDQARIHGLFQLLLDLDLNIELISVNPINDDSGTGTGTNREVSADVSIDLGERRANLGCSRLIVGGRKDRAEEQAAGGEPENDQ